MKKGSVIKTEVGKLILHGPTGCGRTSVMDVMLERPPSTMHRNSPHPEPVSVFHVDVTREKWVKLSLQERKEALAKAIIGKKIVADTEAECVPKDDEEQSSSAPEASGGASSTSETQPSTQQEGVQAYTSSPNAEPDVSTQSNKSSLKCLSTFYADLVKLIDKYAHTGEKITSYRKIICIDSGGQPQFHEIIPAFIRSEPNIYMFIFKLSESFATKLKVVGTDCPDDLPLVGNQSYFQLFKSCVRPLMTHRIEQKKYNKSAHVMIIGSHPDETDKCSTETRDKKNDRIAEAFLPELKSEIIYHSLHGWNVVIPVNGVEPDEHHKKSMKDLREISCKTISKPLELPLQYFALELVLEEASQILGRNVMSVDECLEAASDLDFDNQSIIPALQFLDEASVAFYFPECAEGVVFTSIQVLLDKVLELVEKVNSLRMDIDKSESKYIADEWQALRDRGLFSLNMLSREEFQKHYVPNLFTPAHLVRIFKRLNIVQDFFDGQLFMPALLPILENKDFLKHRLGEGALVSPLAVYFPVRCPQLGIFCSLISFLLSGKNQFPAPWSIELEPDSKIPACLYRNCVCFSLPNFSGSVTLMDTMNHFEVHVRPEESFNYLHASYIAQAMMVGIRNAKLMFNYSRCAPELGAACPCDHKMPHIATLNHGYWICDRDSSVYGNSSEAQRWWASVKPPSPGLRLVFT